MKKLLFICLILCSLHVFSQEEDAPKKGYEHSQSYITFELLSFAIPETSRYRFGYIQRLNKRWAVGLDLGYGADGIVFNNNDNNKDYSLFEIRSEVYYTLNPGRKVQQNLSVEVFYINHKATFLNGDYNPEGPIEIIRFQQADYQRLKYGLHLKYGALINFTDRIGFNPYAGIGIRTRDNSFTNVLGGNEGSVFREFFFGGGIFGREGKVGGPSIDLGFKFYYRIN